MVKTRKVPMRKCVVTNERVEKHKLLRLVRTPEGEVLIDETGRMNGRGAYLTKSKEVVLKAMKSKTLSKALGADISDEIYTNILDMIDE